MHQFAIVAVLTTGLIFAGCSGEKESAQQPASQTEAPPPADTVQTPDLSKPYDSTVYKEYEYSGYEFDFNGKPVTVAGLGFVPATQFRDHGCSKLPCVAHYTLGPLKDDVDSATLLVTYYGEEGGTSAEEQIREWWGRMSLPNGRTPQNSGLDRRMTFDGMPARLIQVQGVYRVPGSTAKSDQPIYKDNYRITAVAVEAPKGTVFFELTGPEYTSRVMIEALMPMLRGMRRVT